VLQSAKSIANTALRGERKVYAFLCLFASILYFRWINFDVFSYGDWSYKYLKNLAELTSGATWVANTDFGSFNELLWRAPLDAMFGAFATVGLGSNVSDKLLVFWPIAITSVIAPYVLLRQLSFSKLHAVIGSLFYATNTYFLSINPQGHGLLILAGNLLTLSFALFMRAVDRQSTRLYVWSALVLWLVSVSDFRLFYIGAMLIAGFLAYRWLVARQLPSARLCIFGLVTVLLQVGWLAATAVSHDASATAILSRSLFGGEYWDLGSALTLHYPFWTGTTTSWFIVNNIPIYFWILPAAVIISLYLNRKNTDYGFFGLVAGLGILLSKQTSPPFSWLYPFLYKHLPGFNAFRESTKFYYFTLLAYTVLLTALLAYLSRRKEQVSYRLVVGALLVLVVVNCIPYVSGSMGKLLHPATIPQDYQTIAHLLETDNSSQYRTLWVPVAPRWSYYSTLHPRLSSTSLAALPITSQADNQSVRTAEQIHNLINAPLFQNYVSLLSVKYVFVPLRDIQNNDDFYKFYGDDRQFYIDTLNQIPFLKRVNIGTNTVAAYLNTNYRPYIAATSSVFGIDASTDLEPTANFLTTIGQGTDFADQSQKTSSPIQSRSLTNIFGDMQASDITKGTLTRHVTLQKPAQLYAGQAKPQISYVSNAGTLSLQAELAGSNMSVDGTPAHPSAQAKNTLATVHLQQNQQYFLASGGNVTHINTSPGTYMVGQGATPISILASDGANLIQDGSFEHGPWQQHVSDCNHYDNNATIGMSTLSYDAYDGQKAAELSAANHIACINSSPAPVTAGHSYLLTFHYQAPYAERVAFRVNFNNGKGQTFSVDIRNGADQWHTVRQMVTVPAGASSATIQLRGLPLPNYDNLTFSATTDYDAVSLQEVHTLSSVTPTASGTSAYQSVMSLAPGSHTFTYADSTIDAKNNIPNGDFENGLWQSKVDDCAADIDDLTPEIAMRSISAAAHGKKALELSALRHVACTSSASIPVQEGQTYLFSFDHQSPNTASASYSLSFNDGQKTTLGKYIPTSKAWQNYHTSFTVPVGATQLTVKVYARSYSDSPEATVNRYDDFKLLRVPDVSQQYYLLDQQSTAAGKPKSISFQTYRTYKTVTIQQATQPFYLIMGEAYNPGWMASLAGDSTHVLGTHFEANEFENGWYIVPSQLCAAKSSACRQNADGSYDINLDIQFTPQRVYHLGCIIGGITLAGCIAYLAIGRLRRKDTASHIYRMRT